MANGMEGFIAIFNIRIKYAIVWSSTQLDENVKAGMTSIS